MRMRNRGLKGSQCLAMDRQIRAKKLKGGPAIPGTIQPIMPMIRRMNPRMINRNIRIDDM